MKKMFSLLVSLCVLAYCILIPAGISAESVNLALASAGTKVTASGSIKGKDLSNINDGDNIEEDLGAWWSNNAAGNMWLEFDLGKIAIIDQIAFYSFNMKNVYTTSVKTSIDGTNWTETALKWTRTEHHELDKGYINYKHEHTFEAPVTARYLRFEPTKQAKLHEVEIYGSVYSKAMLSGLSVNGGKLEPAFSALVTDYTCYLDSGADIPTVSALDAAGETVADSSIVQATAETMTAAVTAVEPGKEDAVYTVHFKYIPVYHAHNLVDAEKMTTSTIRFEDENAALTALTDLDETNFVEFWPQYTTAATDKTKSWLMVDLGGETEISAVHLLVGRQNGRDDDSLIKLYYSAAETKPEVDVTGESSGSWRPVDQSNLTRVVGAEDDRFANKPVERTYSFQPVKARYVLICAMDQYRLGVFHLGVYGSSPAAEFTAEKTPGERLSGSFIFRNTTPAKVADKYYAMAVYNDGVLYDVVISDKTAETIAPAAQTEELVLESTKTLPADVSKITAKLFVWDSPVSLRPLMKNIDLQ